MKINQEKVFTPIIITLETRSEADCFIRLIDGTKRGDVSEKTWNMVCAISNEFSNEVQL